MYPTVLTVVVIKHLVHPLPIQKLGTFHKICYTTLTYEEEERNGSSDMNR